MKKRVLFFLLMIISPSVAIAKTNLTIMPIETSNWGDSALLESNGEYLLMDVTYGAPTESSINDPDSVLEFLIANNVKKFDLYLSHYHNDHYGSYNKLTTTGNAMSLMKYILLNENEGNYKGYKYDISTLYLPDPKICYDSDLTGCEIVYEGLKSAAESKGIEVIVLTTGSKFSFGNTNAEVLHINTDAMIIDSDLVPDKDSLINNSSLVTMFTNGKTKFLSAGDIEQYTENYLVSLGIDVSADIYKLAHHGFQNLQGPGGSVSNIKKFIDRVNPKYTYFQYRTSSNCTYDLIATSINNLSSYSNLYTTQLNGNLKLVIEDDEITPIVKKNGYTITLNYIDKENNEILKSRTLAFNNNLYGNNINYYLYDYDEYFNGYTISNENEQIIQSGVLTENKIYNIYYTKNNYTLTIKHINEKGEEITDSETNTYKYNSSYSTKASEKLLEEYDLIEEPKNSSGIITENKEIIYKYRKKDAQIVEVPNTFKNNVFPLIGLIISLVGLSIIVYKIKRRNSFD